MSHGTSLIRVVGEMGGWRESFVSDQALLEYERALDAVVKRFPSIVLCQFDVREFSGTTVIEAFKSHPDVFKVNLANLPA